MKSTPLIAMVAAMISSAACTREPATGTEPPVMGWSSWNTYRVNISDTLILKQADAMVALGLKDVGYNYINIDDGFFGCRDGNGVMQAHPERFPGGMRAVTDCLHSLGLKAGIYSDAGSNTCGSIWDGDRNGVGAGLYGHEQQDAGLYFNDWGFDFIKIDYCGAGQELNLDEEERYTEIRRAIDAVGAGDVSINICRWAFPGTWARNLARSWRISSDITPSWNSIKHIIGKNLYLSAYAGEGHYNDMDMLEIGRGLSLNEEEVHFGMWCIMSSPLLIGCDLTAIPEASLSLLKNEELIALDQDPLGLQAYVVQHEGGGYVLVKDIGVRRGNVRAVALYNPTDTAVAFSVPMRILELDGRVALRDLVRREDLSPVSDGVFERELEPRSVLILRAEGERRIEPALYEAEWAFLPCFNDLGKDPKSVDYVPRSGASGGMVVTRLGGRAENHALWSVHSDHGGKYRMTVYYFPRPYSRLEIDVNGGAAQTFDEAALGFQRALAANGGQVLDGLEAGADDAAPQFVTEQRSPSSDPSWRAFLEPDPSRRSSLETDSSGRFCLTLTVELEPGTNTIRVGSPFCWAPDLDCFVLERAD